MLLESADCNMARGFPPCPQHTHPLSGLWLAAQGDSLVEPFLVLGKLRRKCGECGNGVRVEPRRREKVFTQP